MNTREQLAYPTTTTMAELDVNSDIRLTRMLAITAVMCIAIAGLLKFLVPTMEHYPFSNVLMHSISIGLTAALLSTFVLNRLDTQRRTSALWLIGLLIPVSTVAFFAGSAIAKLFLGLPYIPFSVFANKNDTVSLITTIVATATITGLFMSRDEINRLKLQAAEDEHRAESAKLSMLQAQVEPHMLFNTLANLRALISVDPERAVMMLDKLEAFLRMTLEGSRNSTNELSNEFAGIENYLAIMQIRLGERLSYSLALAEELAGIKVPSLLIQPVVENALLHGIEPAIDGGHLTVSAWLELDVLSLEIIDTGVGINDTKPARSTVKTGGFGLHSLRERLPEIDGQPGISIDSPLPGSANGTKVLLRVKV